MAKVEDVEEHLTTILSAHHDLELILKSSQTLLALVLKLLAPVVVCSFVEWIPFHARIVSRVENHTRTKKIPRRLPKRGK